MTVLKTVLKKFVFNANFPIAYRYYEEDGKAFLSVAHIDHTDLRTDVSRTESLDWIPEKYTSGVRTHWSEPNLIEDGVFGAGLHAQEKIARVGVVGDCVSDLRTKQRKQNEVEVDAVMQELDSIGSVADWAVFQLSKAVNAQEEPDVVLLEVCEKLVERYGW